MGGGLLLEDFCLLFNSFALLFSVNIMDSLFL